MKNTLVIIILFVFVWCSASAQSNIERLKRDVYTLASDSFEGRHPYTRGDTLSVEYILNEFKKNKVELYNQNGKQQVSFPFQRHILQSEFIVNGTSYQFKRDFIPSVGSKSGTFESEAVFAGYGLLIRNKDSVLYNHFKNIDAKGKWIIYLDDKPDNFEFSNMHYGFLTKTANARKNGAKGVIIVLKDNVLPEQSLNDLFELPFPIFYITNELFVELCKQTNLNADSLRKQASEKAIFNAVPFNLNIKSHVNIKLIDGYSNNIIGITYGSDPKLKNEYIVVGAHFDHLGISPLRDNPVSAPQIHNGADDNASGVAGILELMRIVQEMPVKPKRSIIWVAFAAEELGLIGSKVFVENPPVPLNQIAAMINLDMIGRLKDNSPQLTISGTGTAKIFTPMINKLATKQTFRIIMNPDGEGPSDHARFFRKRIPVLFFNSGLHEDYHRPTDDADIINYNGMKDIVNFAYQLLLDIANYNKTIKFKETKSEGNDRNHGSVKFTLGIVPDVTGSKDGLLVEGVRSGGIAEKAGIKKGDIIIEINGKTVKNIQDYMNRLNELENENTIRIKVKRNNEIKMLSTRIN